MSYKEIDISDFPFRSVSALLIRKSDDTDKYEETEKRREKEKTLKVIKRSFQVDEVDVAEIVDAEIEVIKKKVIIQSLLRDVNQHQYIIDVEQLPAVQLCIREKIRGYKTQDVKKNKYDAALFIDFNFVVSMLQSCATTCYYCQKGVCVIYDKTRDKRQWTIERIDNNRGHNKDNVEIACLQCNLARCTVSSANYVKTKGLSVIKSP
jgi:hypothetical protein